MSWLSPESRSSVPGPDRRVNVPEALDRSQITIYLSIVYTDSCFSRADQLRAMETLADLINPGGGHKEATP
jgi:hypothetical protein